ncbi:MAG: hypothetical protein HY752_06530 [Nitrospirae bacterium]|nr:hypothetical protein [Nitrospirota bacterium]
MTKNTPYTLHPTRYTLSGAGFTFLELIIVLFLISLILGLSVVFFANILPSSRFDATARELSATIRYARALAKISGERKTITIDLDSKKYGIEGHGERGISSGIGIKVKDPLSGEISTGKYQLVFNAAGDIVGGTIVLQDKKRTSDIEIDPVVGAVVVR